MNLLYKKAGSECLEILVKTRIEVLRAANRLDGSADMRMVERQSRNYYQSAFRDGSHTAILVFDQDTVVGTGGVSYYRVMPTWHNQSGQKAYIMNLYTAPEYRRMGIASAVLDLLVSDAKGKGITQISLEATEMGRPLYEKYGFIKMNDEMELPPVSLPPAFRL